MEIKEEQNIFYELLQVAIGNRERLSIAPSHDQWGQIVEIACDHSMIGIAYCAILKLIKLEYDFDKRLLLKIIGKLEMFREKNAELDEDCRVLTNKFSEAGFDTCILKGQGVNLLYENNIVRTPGDVDIWVCPKVLAVSLEDRRLKVHEFCVSLVGEQHTVYHHMDFPVKKNPVEVHFTPSWMYSPFANKRLQCFFDEQWENKELCDKGFYVPSLEFNLVYLLVHIFRHLLDEGIGLRQFLDFYYVLIYSYKEDCEHRFQAIKMIRSLGLERFAAAIMYIQNKVFALHEDYFLCEPEEKLGQFILDEIMLGGNFGQLDFRYDKKRESGGNTLGFHNLWVQVKHNIKFLRYFPSEVLWNVPFRIWHYLWRKRLGWR
jgi:hypothetical protein